MQRNKFSVLNFSKKIGQVRLFLNIRFLVSFLYWFFYKIFDKIICTKKHLACKHPSLHCQWSPQSPEPTAHCWQLAAHGWSFAKVVAWLWPKSVPAGRWIWIWSCCSAAGSAAVSPARHNTEIYLGRICLLSSYLLNFSPVVCLSLVVGPTQDNIKSVN